jgi:hypothetical protein
VRDPSTLLIAFVLPLILLFLFGYAINLDTARTRMGLALLDRGAAAASLATAFENSRWFDIKVSDSVAPLKGDLIAGRVRGIVVIPQDFARRNADGRRRHRGDHRRLAAEHRDVPGRLCGGRARQLGGGAGRGARSRNRRRAAAAPIDVAAALLVQSRADQPLLPGAGLDGHRADHRSVRCSPRWWSRANGSAARWRR